ncbi:hypothetical protein OK349_06485 [Sphingomonas sp. BT-65]|uniref:hypothetical protein n=1 Tax=Sphingomonas sp. BT-65 TaxID=2989821 RepID=UPI0022355D26|nr:hypothetical protein [Sphingomonas sp. BT-65]MCW4461348.1 hypothetical protein [Sphingomonas sp. BT-65]
MGITDLVATGYLMCLDSKKDLHSAWISQSFKLAAIAGEAHIASIQANNRLDLLLRALEEEWEQPPEAVIDYSLDLRYSLSECWVLRSYEVVRAAAQQLYQNGDANEKVAAIKHRLGLVRMPVAKAEIQQARKVTDPIVLVHEDGSNPKEYANDGSYVIPRQVCADTGSAMWCPVDVLTGESVQIRRIDLSSELLTLLD